MDYQLVQETTSIRSGVAALTEQPLMVLSVEH
jgi:hypothetical protein